MNVRERTTVTGSEQQRPSAEGHYPLQGSARHATAQVEQAVLRRVSAERLAHGLGWFSIALGIAELLAPQAIGRLAGGRGRRTTLIRLYGLREIASGVMILSQGRRPASGVWSRVAGDAVDLATLGIAAFVPSTNKAALSLAAANVAGVAALDVICARQLTRESGKMTEDGALRTRRSIVVNRSREELYRYWRNVENLPRFMHHLQSVEATGERSSRWITRGPAGSRVEWEAEITADRPGEAIAWQSLAGSDVYNRGSVHFESRPGARGTLVRVELEYRPPGGIAGTAFAMLFSESPEQQIYDDLRRFKQIMETGEVLHSDGTPGGTGQVMQRPAQPRGTQESRTPTP